MEDRDYILFEDYLTNELNEDQKTAFEKRLKEDKDFREAFELYQSTSRFLSHKFSNPEERESFKRNLNKISNSYSKTHEVVVNKTRYFKPWKLAIAASLLVLMGVFYSQWFSSSPQYQDFADHPEINITVRGNNQPLKKKAEKAFNTENYKEAIPLFKSILIDEPKNIELQLYLSISLIEQDKFKEADSTLKSILESPNAYSNQVKWYAALSQLKQGDYEMTKVYLELITEDAMEYDQAQDLIHELN